MDDTNIIRLIKNKKYSELSFLEDSYNSSKNEKHIGYYYFMCKEQNRESKKIEKIEKEITRKLNNESLMYSYLGNIAKDIFKNRKHNLVEYYYKKSIEKDDKNYEGHYGLYQIKNNIEYALTALKYAPNNKKIDILLNIKHSNLKNLNIEQWKELESNIKQSPNKNATDKKILENTLMLCYLYLDKNNLAIELFKNEKYLSLEIINEFYTRGLITEREAANKTYIFQLRSFFNNDKRKTFNHLKSLNKKEKIENIDLIMTLAFETESYKEMISLYSTISKNPNQKKPINIKLYYIISQIFSNIDTDKKIRNEILENFNLLNEKDLSLLYVLKTKENLKQLKNEYKNKKNKSHSTITQQLKTA